MKITDLIIDPRSLGSKLWLVEVSPAYEYRENRKTDTVLGYRYTVAMPEKGLDKINVRIDGDKRMDAPDGYAEVRFDGLSVPEAGVTEIAGVVIGQGDSLHTALHQRLHILGIAAEGVFRVGLQTARGKGAFQIGQRQIVGQQKLRHVGKGISVIVPHQLFKVAGMVT